MDGVLARMPKNNSYNNGNVPFELLIRRNTIINKLGKFSPKCEQNAPERMTLSEVGNTSQRISKFHTVLFFRILLKLLYMTL